MKNLLFTAFMFACEICNAQQVPDYCVYLVKGKVTIANLNASPVQIKQKQFLYKNQILILAKNSEVTLINKDDKLLVLNTPGSIKANDLAKKFNSSSPSVTKSYLNLAFHELLDPNYDYTSFKQKNVGGIRGGVSRGGECGNMIFPINGLITSKDSIQFSWHTTNSRSAYTLLIYDKDGKELINQNVTDTTIIMDKKNLRMGNGHYYWMVKGIDAACEDEIPIWFNLITKDSEFRIIQPITMNKQKQDLLARLHIIDQLVKKGLVYVAIKNYYDLIKDNSNDVALKKSYVLLLLNYGFNKEGQTFWNNNLGN